MWYSCSTDQTILRQTFLGKFSRASLLNRPLPRFHSSSHCIRRQHWSNESRGLSEVSSSQNCHSESIHFAKIQSVSILSVHQSFVHQQTVYKLTLNLSSKSPLHWFQRKKRWDPMHPNHPPISIRLQKEKNQRKWRRNQLIQNMVFIPTTNPSSIRFEKKRNRRKATNRWELFWRLCNGLLNLLKWGYQSSRPKSKACTWALLWQGFYIFAWRKFII